MRTIAFLILQFGLVTSGFAQNPPKLYVFMPSNVRPNSMERFISNNCDKLQIQVFGRHRDLRRTVEAAPPDAILTPDPVATSGPYDAYKSTLRGLRDDSTQESYVLVSVDKPVDLKTIDQLAIGAVDLLGRRAMDEFLTSSLGGMKPKKIEPVTKQEELLTILQFQDVDAIFVQKHLVDSYFKKRSKMALVATDLPVKVNLPVLSVKSEDQNKVDLLMDCLRNLPSSIKNRLGVDNWVSP